jgi:bifunctional non-homologous end joining protein LigD
MRLLRIPEPFDSPEFIFEPKIDGFRALAYIERRRCRLLSRNGHEFKSWPQLAEEAAHAVRAKRAVLDGEICCLNPDGRSNFNALLFRRDSPYFYAFDVLSVDGEDLTSWPLHERKRLLVSVLPKSDSRLLYLDHIAERGRDLYDVVCRRDLEGIVAKWTRGTYQTDGRRTSWLKIKNAEYSQVVDRHELFAARAEGAGRRSPMLRPGLSLVLNAADERDRNEQ